MAQKTAQELSDAAESTDLNADQFAQYLNDLGGAIQSDLDQLFRRAALELYRRVVARTPVKTGLMRSNWQLSAHLNDLRLDPVPDPPEPDAAELDGNQVLWLFNNLSYAAVLEAGDSGGSGTGAVALSLEEMKHWLERELQKMGYL